jgi:ubiquinone/menaquinone biosynthesis C-methylase UbiE
MEYLPPVQRQPQPQSGALKYNEQVAAEYDAKRTSSAKWTVEQQIIEDMLSDLPEGRWILDAPCGTGRFVDYCLDRKFIYRGIDVSEAMMKHAKAKPNGRAGVFRFSAPDGEIIDVPQVVFEEADLRNSGIPDKSVDAVLNIRITRWLSPEECQQMFREMQRISRDRIILTARVCNHSHARPLALFEAVMSPEWRLERSECGASGPADAPVEDPAYRIFLFKRRSARQQYPGHIVFDAVKNADDAWVMDPYEAA